MPHVCPPSVQPDKLQQPGPDTESHGPGSPLWGLPHVPSCGAPPSTKPTARSCLGGNPGARPLVSVQSCGTQVRGGPATCPDAMSSHRHSWGHMPGAERPPRRPPLPHSLLAPSSRNDTAQRSLCKQCPRTSNEGQGGFAGSSHGPAQGRKKNKGLPIKAMSVHNP